MNMKPLFLMISAMVLASLSAAAQSSYSRKGKSIVYGGRIVKYADYKTFESLGYGYGKDKRHVYYLGRVLEYVAPEGFTVSYDYALPKDRPAKAAAPDTATVSADPLELLTKVDGIIKSKTVTTTDSVVTAITDANSAVFMNYVVSGDSVTYDGMLLPGAVANEFTDLGSGYGKDSKNVFFMGVPLDGADAGTFKTLEEGYASDKMRAYYNGNVLTGADGATFVCQGKGFATDGKLYFIYGNKLEK